MSQYVILIRTTQTLDIIEQEYTGYAYALTTTHHPPTGLALLQNYSPVRLVIAHTIAASSQTETLLRTLQIKFQHRLLHSFWYAFSSDDLAFIQGLNETNFSQMIGFIQRQIRKPEFDEKTGPAFVAELLAKAEAAIK